MEEKRKSLRLTCIIDGIFSRGNLWSEENSLIVKDISVGGLSFISHTALNRGEALDLSINTCSLTDEPVKCIGEVVWVKSFEIGGRSNKVRYEVGLKFIKLGEEEKGKIEGLIKYMGKDKK